MEKINETDFNSLIEKGGKVENKIIPFSSIHLKNNSSIEFTNCTFTSKTLIIDDFVYSSRPYESKIILKLINCNFHSCKLHSNFTVLFISNIKVVDEFSISNSTINLFNFEDCLDIDYKIHIANCIFNEILAIQSNEFKEKGEIRLSKVEINKESMISNNLFNELSFFDVTFKKLLVFDNNFLRNSKSCFNYCNFEKASFSHTHFESSLFDDCKFYSTTWFENCKNINNSKLKFVACEFKGFVLFDNSKINFFEIAHSFFERKVSFDSFETNKMKLHQVSFEKVAYFDDLNKSNEKALENWDRKTLRAIKRELVNTHNQIDYLRFKAYELEAFKKEKGKSWKDNAILKLNSCSSKNGLDWFRGLLFTIIVSILFFYLYSIIEVYTFWSNPLDYNFISLERVKEYFFFLNPSNFNYHFDKLKSNKPNITIIVTTIIFVFAKAFIGYGIYQTIQAFRKFGVNGG